MKNVVIISSSPRINGNSELLCKEFYKGAIDAGHNAKIINLREHKLDYCIGCYACKTLGECFRKDDGNALAKMLLDADVIVFATPVYFYSMSGQLKVFIDRLTPFYTKIKADIYLIATMWDRNPTAIESTFEAIRGLTRDCFEGCTEKGTIIGHSLGSKGKVVNYPDLLNQAYTMGKNC